MSLLSQGCACCSLQIGKCFSGCWRKCVQLTAMHTRGAFSVLGNELLWNKFGLLLLNCKNHSWGLEAAATPKKGKAAQGEGSTGGKFLFKAPKLVPALL